MTEQTPKSHPKPLSDARMAEIQAWMDQSPATLGAGYAKGAVYTTWLFPEVERLRAELAARDRTMATVRIEVADLEPVKQALEEARATIATLTAQRDKALEFVRYVAHEYDDDGELTPMAEQARAVLAAAGEAVRDE